MSFWLYERQGDSLARWNRMDLAGPNGLLAKHIRKIAPDTMPFGWRCTAVDLVVGTDKEMNASNCEIVFDLSANENGSVCLYLIQSISGTSHAFHSDVILSCNLLFQGKLPMDADSFRSRIPIPEELTKVTTMEALGLSGGAMGGTFKWCKPKMEIGAAVI